MITPQRVKHAQHGSGGYNGSPASGSQRTNGHSATRTSFSAPHVQSSGSARVRGSGGSAGSRNAAFSSAAPLGAPGFPYTPTAMPAAGYDMSGGYNGGYQGGQGFVAESYSVPVQQHSNGYGYSYSDYNTGIVPAPQHASEIGPGGSGVYVPPHAAARRHQVGGYRRSAHTPPARRGSGSAMPHPPIGVQVMNGISEYSAIEEFAYRRGQQDRDSGSELMPPNPYDPQYDELFAEYYKRGRESTGASARDQSNAPFPSFANYMWPVLVNPQTQSFEQPHGSFDAEWARNICVRALDSMAALISVVVYRRNGWEKLVVDIPAPVLEALPAYPDLMATYEAMKCDAQEALAGGRPLGYEA